MPETLREGDQPLPIHHIGVEDIQTKVMRDIVDRFGKYEYIYMGLVEDITKRRAVGIERYGSALQPHNGRDALRDAYEEALDLCMYLKQLIEEGNHFFEEVYTQVLNVLFVLKDREP